MNQRKPFFVLLFCIVIFANRLATGAIITGIERRYSYNTPPLISGPLQESSPGFVDRVYEYRMVPADLIGAEYIMVANDDKLLPNYELDVMLSRNATLYLMLDNRLGHGPLPEDTGQFLDPDLNAAGMQWVLALGFVDTQEHIIVYEKGATGIFRWSSVYALNVSAGTVTLFQQCDATDQQFRNMYGVAVVPEASTVLLLLFGTVLAGRRLKA